jgi:uncharacterized cupin superfamily protein
MEKTIGLLGRARVDTDEFEPYFVGDEQHGEIHFVRNDVLENGPYVSAIWRLTEEHLPYSGPYEFVFDETIHIVEGEADLTFPDGETVHVTTGDVFSVAAGTSTTWHVTEPFRKLVIVR